MESTKTSVLPYTVDAILHAITAWKEKKTELSLICSALLLYSFENCDKNDTAFMKNYTREFAKKNIEQLHWIGELSNTEKLVEELGYKDFSEKLSAKYREVPIQQIIKEVAEKFTMNTFFKWLITYSTVMTILEASKGPKRMDQIWDWIDKHDIRASAQSLVDLKFDENPLDTIIMISIEAQLKDVPEAQHCQVIERLKNDIPDKPVVRFEGDILNDLIGQTGHIPSLFKIHMIEPTEDRKMAIHPRDILARTYEILVLCSYSALKHLPVKFNV